MNVDDLSLREQAAQLIFPRLGSNMPPPVTAAEDLERFEKLLDDYPVGGLIVFNGSYPATTDALSRLQQRSNIPLLVSTDMERGVGQQIKGATVFPHAMAFSAAGDERLLEDAARVQAREALACGIHITFSPVADVNRDPRNPIIATRAFGTEPEDAARLASAYIRGCRAEGLLTTAKHFPGHGNTSQDSHSELPVVESGREELDDYDLVPFRASIEAGVDLVMTAHVVYPSLDPDRPATLSPRILRDLLREDMGFRGCVITDSLLMGAIRSSHERAEDQAAALVEAGVDILLDVADPRAAVDGIVQAVDNGRLERRLVSEAAGRVLELKRRVAGRFGKEYFASPSTMFGDVDVGADSHHRLARSIAAKAVHVVDDPTETLPLSNDGEVLAVLIKPHRTRLDPEEEPFGEAIRETFAAGRYVQIGPEYNANVYQSVRDAARKAASVIVALVVKPAAWHAFGLLPEQDALVRDLIRQDNSVVVSLGSPFVLDAYSDAPVRLCAYSDVEVSQRAAVVRLVGG